jgi:hypothetical protein
VIQRIVICLCLLAGAGLAQAERYPAVFSGGANSLTVWEDYRGVYPDIYGARVDRVGAVLDPTGIPISTAANQQWYPVVSFDGTNWLVVWEDGRSGHLYIYATRVGQTGAALDTNGFLVSAGADNQYYPAVSFGGMNSLLVWEYSTVYSDIYAARVSQAGSVLDPNGIPISTAAGYQENPAVSSDGTNWLVVWTDDRSGFAICGARVSQAGTVLDSIGIPISTRGSAPGVSFDGTNYFVVWTDQRSGSFDIYGTRVSQAGRVLDSSGIPISAAAGNQYYPAVSFDGTDYLVVWQDTRSNDTSDIYAARVSRTGAVLDPNGIPISTAARYQEYPAVSFDGSNWFVVWEDDRSGPSEYHIYAARVSQAGSVLEPGGFRISATGGLEESGAVRMAQGDRGRKATIIGGVLRLPPASSVGHVASSVLLDICGRKVLDLRPGLNDVRRLSPGVYFLRSAVSGGWKVEKTLAVR